VTGESPRSGSIIWTDAQADTGVAKRCRSLPANRSPCHPLARPPSHPEGRSQGVRQRRCPSAFAEIEGSKSHLHRLGRPKRRQA